MSFWWGGEGESEVDGGEKDEEVMVVHSEDFESCLLASFELMVLHYLYHRYQAFSKVCNASSAYACGRLSSRYHIITRA